MTFGHGRYILDDKGQPVICDDLMTWGRFMASSDRRVAQDMDEGDTTTGVHVRVSTVFLGLDHNYDGEGPPVLWETMVFGGVMDQEQVRYTSLADALAGHQEMCARVRETMPRPGPSSSP